MSAPNEPIDPKQQDPSVNTSEQLEGNDTTEAGSGDAAQTWATSPDDLQSGSTDGQPSGGAPDEVQVEENWATMLADAQAQVAQYHEELLRAKAEVENIRRRAQEDVAKARKFGTESFAESLIPVRDSLEAALALTDQSAEAWQTGVEATLRQLNAAFERNLLKEVAPEPGDKFDPHQHQAISSVPSEFPEGTVAQLLQKGYTIAERVLRPALVMVASGQKP